MHKNAFWAVRELACLTRSFKWEKLVYRPSQISRHTQFLHEVFICLCIWTVKLESLDWQAGATWGRGGCFLALRENENERLCAGAPPHPQKKVSEKHKQKCSHNIP